MLDKAITLYTNLKKFNEANELIRKYGKGKGVDLSLIHI